MCNEINKSLHKTPDRCRNCDYETQPLKNYRTGELNYPRIPGGLCDKCRDYQETYRDSLMREAVRLIAQTLNTMPLYKLSDELFEMAIAKGEAEDEDV